MHAAHVRRAAGTPCREQHRSILQGGAHMTSPKTAPDLILHNGRLTTLDRANPVARAAAIRDGRFIAVGDDAEILPLAGPETKRIDLKGRSALPGLIDNHL